MKKRGTLFRRTATLIAGGLLALVAVSAVSLFVLLLKPLNERSADDYAAMLVMSARTWARMPPEARPSFAAELADDFHVAISEAATPVGETAGLAHPYLVFLRQALVRRVGADGSVRVSRTEDDVLHVEFPVDGRAIRLSFPHSRFSPKPVVSIIVLAATAIAVALILAWVLAKRMVGPIERLADAARQIGLGEQPGPLPETGDRELAMLANALNQTSADLAAQRQNQVTLLAGISHDLRSPLARLRMAAGMLAEESRSPLVARMETDIEAMDALIGAQIDLVRARDREPAREVDVDALLREVAGSVTPGGDAVRVRVPGNARIVRAAPVALRRIVANLVENAVVHGARRDVQIVRRRCRGTTLIGVRDRGRGIPSGYREAIFRPYFRVEPSRSRATGGSGLGLAIARQLAQTHGWTLAVKPRFGGGSSFWLAVPDDAGRHRDAGEAS